MKKSLTRFAVSVAMLLVGNLHLFADSIPWGYSASAIPTNISASTSPLSSITFSGASGVASGSSGIVIYSLNTNSSATDAAPDSFSSVPFNLAISLTDMKATGSALPGAMPTAVVHFSGLFNATNVTGKSSLPGVIGWTMLPGNVSPTEAVVTLGSAESGWRTYDVQLASFTAPGQPGGAPGSIQAIVTIDPTHPGGLDDFNPAPPSNTPEPASIVLISLGLPLAVLLRRRKS